MASRRRVLRTAVLVVAASPGCISIEEREPGADTLPGLDDDNTEEENDEPDGDEQSSRDEPVDERVRDYERAVHEQVNEVRQENDRESLAFNDDIAAVAREHSVDMAERGYFSHESPEGEGPADRMEAFFPGECGQIGENIANVSLRPDDAAEAVADRIVSGWMDSPGHRENLRREVFDAQGIGVAVTEDDSVLATQKFCDER